MFIVDSAKLEDVKRECADDVISRQSITYRDGSTLNEKRSGYIVFIEGTEEGVKRAEDLIGKYGERLPKNDSESLYKFFKEQDQNVADGLGAIFGE